MDLKTILFIGLGFGLAATSCNSVQSNPIKKEISVENENAAAQQAEEKPQIKVGLAVGNKAPELDYTSPDGKSIKLSSLKGKMVLIDFWASWCPPCRVENPNLVRTYEQFNKQNFQNGKGFTIYSVSLDQQKERWVGAIKTDKLSWSSHVSDLKGWQSVPAAMYQVTSIPSNFLIDGDGIIVATNLRGENLGLELQKLLK